MVNMWHEGERGLEIRAMIVQSIAVLYGEILKDFCQNLIQPFLENVDSRSRYDGSWKLIQEYHEPRRKDRSCPPA